MAWFQRVPSFAAEVVRAVADRAATAPSGEWAGFAGLVASCASCVASVARRARLSAALAVAWLRVHVHDTLGCSPPPPCDDWQVYRVYAFCEDNEDGFFKEVAVRTFRWDSWESDVRAATGWRTFRVEVRYTIRNRKFRMIMRLGDHGARFPPYDTPRPACRFPRGVLSARLCGKDADGSPIDVDVTARVIKYQGPHADFHAKLGLVVRVSDMFPFDDADDNRARFQALRVTDALARMRDFRYGDVLVFD